MVKRKPWPKAANAARLDSIALADRVMTIGDEAKEAITTAYRLLQDLKGINVNEKVKLTAAEGELERAMRHVAELQLRAQRITHLLREARADESEREEM